jgi:hypothetical protein
MVTPPSTCSIRIGSYIVNFFVFHKHDGDVLNQSNYNKDGSPESRGSSLHLSTVLLEEKRHDGDKGGVDGIHLGF